MSRQRKHSFKKIEENMNTKKREIEKFKRHA